METLVMEFLIRIKGSEGLCNNVDSFENLLRINEKIKINNNSIEFEDLEIEFNNKKYISEDNIRVFDLVFIVSNIDRNKVKKFEMFLRNIREILYKISDDIDVLQDDLSMYYSTKIYPKFNEIENLMRKLLTKFMVLKVGENWDSENIPKKVKESIESAKKKDSYGFLYKSDFIDLSNFLFNKYSNKPVEELIKNISDKKEINTEDYIKKSNWERYFKEIVKCEDNYLNKQWNSMYELRCKVAHNNKFSREDYDKALKIYNDIKPIINEAINKIDIIVISVEERKIFTENIINNSDEMLGRFISKFNQLEMKINIYLRIKNKDKEHQYYTLSRILNDNYFRNNIDLKEFVQYRRELKRIVNLRNMIIHRQLELKEIDIKNALEEIELFIEKTDSILNRIDDETER
ncbi:MAG: hypothetical protein ACRDCB_13115 [Clostridium sp.]